MGFWGDEVLDKTEEKKEEFRIKARVNFEIDLLAGAYALSGCWK